MVAALFKSVLSCLRKLVTFQKVFNHPVSQKKVFNHYVSYRLIFENDLPRLANGEALADLISSYPKERENEMLFGLLREAIDRIWFIEFFHDNTELSDDQSLWLLRSTIKSILPYFATRDKWLLWKKVAHLLTIYDLWKYRDVTLAWFQAGLPILHEFWRNPHSQPWLQIDEEIYLLIAEHCIDDKSYVFAFFLPDELKRKKEFMMEAVRRDPVLYGSWWGQDFDVDIAVFARVAMFDLDFVTACWIKRRYFPDFFLQLANHLQSQLAAYDLWNDPSSYLIWLDDSLWQEICDYLSLGQKQGDLETLQQAERNLSRYLQDPNVAQTERELELDL